MKIINNAKVPVSQTVTSLTGIPIGTYFYATIEKNAEYKNELFLRTADQIVYVKNPQITWFAPSKSPVFTDYLPVDVTITVEDDY